MKKIEEMDYETAHVVLLSHNATTKKAIAASRRLRRLEIAAISNMIDRKGLTRIERMALMSAERVMEYDLECSEEATNGGV